MIKHILDGHRFFLNLFFIAVTKMKYSN